MQKKSQFLIQVESAHCLSFEYNRPRWENVFLKQQLRSFFISLFCSVVSSPPQKIKCFRTGRRCVYSTAEERGSLLCSYLLIVTQNQQQTATSWPCAVAGHTWLKWPPRLEIQKSNQINKIFFKEINLLVLSLDSGLWRKKAFFKRGRQFLFLSHWKTRNKQIFRPQTVSL